MKNMWNMQSEFDYREGLEIGSNNTLLVEEGTSARITHYDLRSKNIPIKQPTMERRNFCNPEYANVYNAGPPQGDTRANGASGHSLHPTLRTTSRWHIFLVYSQEDN